MTINLDTGIVSSGRKVLDAQRLCFEMFTFACN